MTALLAWAIAQIFKIISWAFVSKELNFKRLVEPGGMPSSHSAFVTALCTGIGIHDGFESTIFALSAVFAAIVMYDASGVRRAASQ